ncbi:MAG: right-handed parallel beta-helix repeat-containing protein [Clostridia bacterium]|nr:right-handed parallel beta-helix repeat-containing protein [Clostridia bacterium]
MSKNRSGRLKLPIAALCVCLIFAIILSLCLSVFRVPLLTALYKGYKLSSPSISSDWAEKTDSPASGDYYVSTSGSDENDGTRNAPFRTIKRALDAVANTDRAGRDGITVCIEAGEYNIEALSLLSEHGGSESCPVTYRGYGDGEVILNAGTKLSPEDFAPSKDYPEISERLPEGVKDSVYVIDLSKPPYNLTVDDWGELYPIGTYNTSDRYSGKTAGPMYSELFIDGVRQSLGRYPDEGYVYVDGVDALGKEQGNKENGDPAGDVLSVNETLSDRISSWAEPSEVWVYGFWQYDWADGSSPIESFDENTNRLTTKYQSFFGVREGAPYFFYNCLEELSKEGEWYLDRERGLLCVFSESGLEGADIELSLSTDTAITLNASYVTLSGLTVKGTRGNGIVINGDNNTVTDSRIVNIGSHAMIVHGFGNLITRNEISGIGRGGIAVTGGDRSTLLAGGNTVSNNLIHNWSEVYKTYQAGINIGGVGNICANNELYDSPHLAITYDGNNHIFEYNLIHDVCLESDDAGAIYAGMSWSSYGNEIRHNLIYDLGSGEHSPNGIYMDDAISGQSIEGNILINIPGHAIFVGGGRDMTVEDNLIVNSGDAPIRYDARAREGMLLGTWFSDSVDPEHGALWRDLFGSPWQSEIWQSAFPEYKEIITDREDIDDPRFMANPAGSSVKNNIVLDKCASLGNIDTAVSNYSSIADNKTYYLWSLGSIFTDHRGGDYSVKRSARIDERLGDILSRTISGVGRY